MGIAGLAEKPRPQPDPVRSSIDRMRLASSPCSRALSASDRARDGSEEALTGQRDIDQRGAGRPKVAHDVVTQSGPGPQAAQWCGRERCLRARLRRDNIGAILITVVNCEWIRGCKT